MTEHLVASVLSCSNSCLYVFSRNRVVFRISGNDVFWFFLDLF